MVIDKTVGRLCPFQDDVGPLFTVIGEKPAVQLLTFLLEHTYLHLDTRLTQLPDATTLHFREFIDTAHHHTLHTFLDDQIGTGGRLPVVGTGLQTHVESSFLQQQLIIGTHTRKGIHLGMTFTTPHVIPLTDNPAVAAHDHSTHHRVWFSILLTVFRQLNTPLHEFFVSIRHIFTFFIYYYLSSVCISRLIIVTLHRELRIALAEINAPLRRRRG